MDTRRQCTFGNSTNIVFRINPTNVGRLFIPMRRINTSLVLNFTLEVWSFFPRVLHHLRWFVVEIL